MAHDFGPDLPPTTFCHRLLHKVSRLIYHEPKTPEHVDILGLTKEMRLVWRDDRDKRVGLSEAISLLSPGAFPVRSLMLSKNVNLMLLSPLRPGGRLIHCSESGRFGHRTEDDNNEIR